MAVETVPSWDARLPTGQLNTWIKEVLLATPTPVRGSKQPRIVFATRATNQPPTFVFFTSRFLEVGYRRFSERRLRAIFDFAGLPIRINVRCGRSPRRGTGLAGRVCVVCIGRWVVGRGVVVGD